MGNEIDSKSASPEADGVAAGAELPEIVADLEAVCARIRGVHERLPISPSADLEMLDEADMKTPTLVRLTLECLLADRLEPAVRELRVLAALRRKEGST